MSEKAISDKIDFIKSEQYILSIRLNADGFSFSIYNPIRDRFVLSRQWEIKAELSFTANLKEAFKAFEFLEYTYKHVEVVWIGKRFTLLPLDFFDEEQAETVFYYNYQPKENEIVLSQTLQRSAVAVLYAMDKSAYNFLCKQYPEVQFYSSIAVLAEQFVVQSRLGSDKKMYVNLRSGFIELYVYECGHLMLLNPFVCKHASDRVFYVLYVWKQLAMDQQQDELFIVQDNISDEQKNEFMDGVQRFIQHISVIGPINELNKQ